jgi:hypothetical protein
MNELDFPEYDEAAEAAYVASVRQAQAAFTTRWPNHCPDCGGWGGHHSRATRWEPETFDPCEALPEGSCHRAGPRTPCRWNS